MKKAYPIELLEKYPAISDLEKRGASRIPDVAWQYLQTGTGEEHALAKNLKAFEKIEMLPRFMKGEQDPQTSVSLMGTTYDAPFGMAPIGLSGLMWPGAEMLLAQTASDYNIPYCLSTVAAQTPETVGPHIGKVGWFQLYPPREAKIRQDLLDRVKKSGFHTLVVTADVPKPARRERTKRAGMRTPPRITPKFILDGVLNPWWSMRILKYGIPKLKTIEKYAEGGSTVYQEIRAGFGGTLDWQYMRELRKEWDGPIVLKGITHPEDARIAAEEGLDGIIVSNHGGRQFDAVPAAIDLLPGIVEVAKGKTAIMFDSGIRSGLDIIKALHLGAEFVFLGRPFLYGLAAMGNNGGAHVCEILLEDIKINMIQLGITDLKELG
jgi:L-lactate dehydrogenase (cytochrome)